MVLHYNGFKIRRKFGDHDRRPFESGLRSVLSLFSIGRNGRLARGWKMAIRKVR